MGQFFKLSLRRDFLALYSAASSGAVGRKGRCVCGCAVDALSTRKVCLWLRGRCALHQEGVSVVARSMRSPPRRCVCGCAVDALSPPPFGVSVVARSMRSPPRPSTGGGSINFLFAFLTVTQRRDTPQK